MCIYIYVYIYNILHVVEINTQNSIYSKIVYIYIYISTIHITRNHCLPESTFYLHIHENLQYIHLGVQKDLCATPYISFMEYHGTPDS